MRLDGVRLAGQCVTPFRASVPGRSGGIRDIQFHLKRHRTGFHCATARPERMMHIEPRWSIGRTFGAVGVLSRNSNRNRNRQPTHPQ